jgi:fructose-bisphosphate aldolase class 1
MCVCVCLCRALTFSFGRALQQTCLSVWKGGEENTSSAQTALVHRAQAHCLGVMGRYKGGVGGEAANKCNFVPNYIY